MSETKINDLRINKGLTKQQLIESTTITENELSFVTDDTVVDVPAPTEAGKVLTSTANGVEWATGGGGGGAVDSVNGKTGVVVLTGEDISADVNELTDTVQGHLQTLHDNIKDIELFKFPNATIIGEPIIDHGQVSGFSESSYLQFPFVVDLHNQPFVIDFCFTTGNDVTTQQNILDSQFGLALAIANGRGLMAISHNGTSWAGSVTGTMPIQPNTTYYARLSWNRINYQTQLSTDGTTYTADMNFGSTQSPYPRTMFIGGCSGSAIGHAAHPFGGTINLNYAYLTVAGNVIWQGMDDAGLATRLASDVSNITDEGKEKIKQIVGGAGRNVGDIFYTTRTDTALAGAVECNGGTYSTADYTGEGSIGELLEAGKLDYISLTAYATAISTKGWCDKIGWDGGTTVRVPKLAPKRYVVKVQEPTAGNNYTWYRLYNDGWVEQGGVVSGTNGTITLPITMASSDYQIMPNVKNASITSNNTVFSLLTNNLTTTSFGFKKTYNVGSTTGMAGEDYFWQVSGQSAIVSDPTERAMFQLFNGTTDEAVATVGTVVAQVAENTTQISDLRNMSNITATGKETVVGWGMPDYSAGVAQSGTSFTAPSDGWVYIVRNVPQNSYLRASIDDIQISYNAQRLSTACDISDLIPISKNSVFETASGTSITFFPCKGV